MKLNCVLFISIRSDAHAVGQNPFWSTSPKCALPSQEAWALPLSLLKPQTQVGRERVRKKRVLGSCHPSPLVAPFLYSSRLHELCVFQSSSVCAFGGANGVKEMSPLSPGGRERKEERKGAPDYPQGPPTSALRAHRAGASRAQATLSPEPPALRGRSPHACGGRRRGAETSSGLRARNHLPLQNEPSNSAATKGHISAPPGGRRRRRCLEQPPPPRPFQAGPAASTAVTGRTRRPSFLAARTLAPATLRPLPARTSRARALDPTPPPRL